MNQPFKVLGDFYCVDNSGKSCTIGMNKQLPFSESRTSGLRGDTEAESK